MAHNEITMDMIREARVHIENEEAAMFIPYGVIAKIEVDHKLCHPERGGTDE